MGDDTILGGIARFAKPGAAITLLLSVTARDHLPGVEHLDLAAYAKHGLELQTKRVATSDDRVAARSSWGKRLRAGSERDAWLQVDDVDQAYDELRARGVVFEGPPEDRDWGRRAVTTDPTGHTVHIMSP